MASQVMSSLLDFRASPLLGKPDDVDERGVRLLPILSSSDSRDRDRAAGLALHSRQVDGKIQRISEEANSAGLLLGVS